MTRPLQGYVTWAGTALGGSRSKATCSGHRLRGRATARASLRGRHLSTTGDRAGSGTQPTAARRRVEPRATTRTIIRIGSAPLHLSLRPFGPRLFACAAECRSSRAYHQRLQAAREAARFQPSESPSNRGRFTSPTVPVGRSCKQGARRYHSLVEVGRSSYWLRRSWRRCPAATTELSQA
jgi:hypothetical protein